MDLELQAVGQLQLIAALQVQGAAIELQQHMLAYVGPPAGQGQVFEVQAAIDIQVAKVEAAIGLQAGTVSGVQLQLKPGRIRLVEAEALQTGVDRFKTDINRL